MSLEATIAANTAANQALAGAIHALIARLAAGAPIPDNPGAAPAAEAAALSPTPATEVADPQPAAPTPNPAPAPAATTAPTSPTAEAAADAAPASKAASYDDVKAAVIALGKAKGHSAAVAVLQALGVAKAPDLKVEQYADAIAKLQAAL